MLGMMRMKWNFQLQDSFTPRGHLPRGGSFCEGVQNLRGFKHRGGDCLLRYLLLRGAVG